MAEGKPKAKTEVEITFPSPEKEETVGSNIPPFIPAPTSPTYMGEIPEVAPTPKEVPELDIAALRKQLEKMQKQLERVSITFPKKEEVTSKDLKPLEMVKFKMEAPFVLLPALSGVVHPFYDGKPNAFAVSVGSRDWLHTMDEMRAAGWNYYGENGIEMFLLKSAWIVKQELNYNLIKFQKDTSSAWEFLDLDKYVTGENIKKEKDTTSSAFLAFKKDILSRKFKYVNNVEKFVMGYPDNSRQQERLEKGYGKLVKDIRQKLGPYAFLPQNYDTLKEGEHLKCPPKSVEFFVDNIHAKDFLRFWTKYDTTNPMYVQVGGSVRKVFECAPEPDSEFSWIPMEYRQQIEELYNIVQFKYNTGTFKRYLYTLLQHEKLDEPIRTFDAKGRAFITVPGPGKMGYKLFLAQLKLNYSVHEKRIGVPDGESTLREWMEEYISDLSLYPLLQAILNATAPVNEGTPEHPGIFKSYIYNTPGSDGKELKKMYADAPVRIFKHQLVMMTVGRVKPGETYTDCVEKFIRSIYSYIYQKWAPKIDNFPTEVPEKYRKILTSLFEYGGQPTECVTSLTVLSTPTTFGPTLAPPVALTTKEMEGKSGSELKAMIADVLNIVKTLS